MSRAQEFYVRAKKSLAGGTSSSFRADVKPEPIFVDHGVGAFLIDVDGKRHIDFALAWGPLILGHCHPAIKQAVMAQLERGSMFGAQHELEIRVAENIQSHVPCADLVTFANSGSEAILVALRLARAYTGKKRIVKFEGHYHGWTDSVLISYHPTLDQAGPVDSPLPVPGTAGQSPLAMSEVIVLPWNDLCALETTFEQYGDEIAAVIMEPVMCNSGVVAPIPGYLEGVRLLTDRAQSLLIFDEVITGFRLSSGGAQKIFGIIPDIAIYAKAVAGGYPVSVIAGRKSVMDLISNGVVKHNGTYNGNPIGLAATEATLAVLTSPGTYEHLNKLGEMLAQGTRSLLNSYGICALVNQIGPIMQVLFTEQQAVRNYREVVAHDSVLNEVLVIALREEGIILLPDGRWYISVVHTEAEIAQALQALEKAIRKVAGHQGTNKGRIEGNR